MEITNGHAARMRFARFKNQVEGTVPKARASRGKTRALKAKCAKTKGEKKKEGDEKALLELKIGERAGDTAAKEREEQTLAKPLVAKLEPVNEVLRVDIESVDESELSQHNTHVTSTQTLADTDNSAPSQVLATLVQHHPASHPYRLPQQRQPPIGFSPTSNCSFSQELMPHNLYMQSIDDSELHGPLSQDLQMTPAISFYDTYLFPSEPQVLMDGQGRLIEGEQQWDAAFC